MDELINIRQFKQQDWSDLVRNAEADNHSGVYAPTHILEKKKEIVGYLSMAVPTVLSWQDSKKMTAIDSLQEIKFIEGILANQPFICIPCSEESPYNRFLPKAGYIRYTKPVNLYIKVRN
jgi:hypothetical protein